MRGRFAAGLALGAALFLTGCGDAPLTMTGAESLDMTGSIKPAAGGKVYLLRGGLNVFSTGMDELAVKLRARGIAARSEGHAIWKELADDARREYARTKGPIVLVGHSWGALAAVLMAAELAKSNTPVALIMLLDTTDSVKVTSNVQRVINFTSSTGMGLGLTVTGESGFRGHIDQVNEPGLDHMNIDNAAVLQEREMAEILKVIRPSLRTAGQ